MARKYSLWAPVIAAFNEGRREGRDVNKPYIVSSPWGLIDPKDREACLVDWDLEALADELLFGGREGRKPVHRRRSCHPEREMIARTHRREIPIGRHLQRYGVDRNGYLIAGGPEQNFED